MNPWIWAIGSIVVAALEVLMPGFYLIWFAMGGAITALAAFTVDLSLTAQISIFVAASACTCVSGYFVYQKLITSSGQPPLNERGQEMVGAHGTVIAALTNGQGKVELGDSVWLAEGPDLPVGAAVRVTGTRGTVLLVVPV